MSVRHLPLGFQTPQPPSLSPPPCLCLVVPLIRVSPLEWGSASPMRGKARRRFSLTTANVSLSLILLLPVILLLLPSQSFAQNISISSNASASPLASDDEILSRPAHPQPFLSVTAPGIGSMPLSFSPLKDQCVPILTLNATLLTALRFDCSEAPSFGLALYADADCTGVS